MNKSKIWDRMHTGTFIIAEAGKNFIHTKAERPISEYLENAKELVNEAALASADAIKFQTHNVEDEQLTAKIRAPHFSGERYGWVTRNTNATPLNEFWKPLKEHCDTRGVIFFSTPMSRGAAQILNTVGVNLWKIGSCDLLDFPLLDYVRTSGKPIILSSGMSTLEEVEKAVNFVKEKTDHVALLHCVSKYPCPPEELHLKTINFFKKKFNIPIGFSDHSIGIEPDLVAVAMGATIIEKHFSMSRKLWGADHKVSMTPEELRALVSGVREVENNPKKKKEILASNFAKRGLGEEIKILQKEEESFRPVFRKSLMAGQDIAAGTVITAEHLYAMRPQALARGLASEHYPFVLGKRVTKALKKYEPITKDLLI